MPELAAGLRLSLLGLGLVFLVLALLAALVALIVRLDGARDGEEANASAPAVSDVMSAAEAELLAAAVVAVRAHRILKRREAAPALRAHLPGTLPSRWVGAGRTRQNRSFTPGGRYT
jgi:Na+-transporting methylmalonyl-CoA/oxaloacetate decarboxylase gamma subunit